ncbi:MAG TPA: ATP-binding protein [Candidatus Bathyarchaeia archaeon]|nr:ATP-binding protein [Candidatus Bathyarchaeia archaeon]
MIALMKDFGSKLPHATAARVAPAPRAYLWLRETGELWRMLFDQNLAGVFCSTVEGEMLECNLSFARIFGYDSPAEITRRPGADYYFDPADRVRYVERLRAQGSVRNLELTLRKKDGTTVVILENVTMLPAEHGQPEAMLGTVIDITEAKQAQEVMLRAEKLAAAGRLAATIAHEINNPLEAVSNTIFLARTHAETTPALRELLQLAEQQLSRVASITRQTLGFFRGASERTTTSVATILSDALALYQARIDAKNIRLVKQVRFNGPIHGRPGELQQAFSNLVANAIDAVPDGGTLLLRVSHGRDWRSGMPGVAVTVADSGQGIDPKHRKRIFEPFFTTKPDAGTGLGLWLTREIVLRHSGRIRVRTSSQQGQSGTTISIFLPTAST